VGERRFFPRDDCDDARAEVYPGAFEHCDGLDNDCDGVPDERDDASAAGTACLPVSLVGGGGAMCVRTREGELACWGDNRRGYLGDPAASADATIVNDAAFDLTGLAFGEAGGCGLRGSRVVCWGNGDLFGRSFLGSQPPRGPSDVDGVGAATQVSVGDRHVCALLEDRTVRCWGESLPSPNVDGVTVDGAFTLPPTTVVGLTDAVEVDVGSMMSCARRSGGDVWCWGFNFMGVLGTGDDGVERARPVLDLDDARALAVGASFACAVRSSGELWCWGSQAG
jgi:alpha-tubulin suppressor-like RCC1 family protein